MRERSLSALVSEAYFVLISLSKNFNQCTFLHYHNDVIASDGRIPPSATSQRNISITSYNSAASVRDGNKVCAM